MIFHVIRTSDFSEKKQPCKEAVKGKYVCVDRHRYDDPRKIPMYQNNVDKWFSKGVNHRVENGHIKRDFTYEGWLIEINTLEELVGFCKKHGEELIFDSREGTPTIEIYDGYRE